MKRLSVCLIAAVTVLCLLALPAEVAATTEADYVYSVSNAEATITGYNGPGGDITIPSMLGGYPVTCIGSSAFMDCTNIRTVVIPEGVAIIGEGAFSGSSVTSIKIPSSVGLIVGTLPGCETWVDANNPNYSSDAVGALLDKSGKTLIGVPRAITGTYSIPAGVTTIDYWGLCGSLTAVRVPLSVKEFKGFPGNDLTEVYYDGTRAQWLGIKMSDRWMEKFMETTIHYEAHVHAFKNYVSNNDATCLTDGTETAVCEGCNVTDTRTVADSALGHSFTYYVSNNDATYDADGTKTAKCDRCDVRDTIPDAGSKLIPKGWVAKDRQWFYYKDGTKCTGWLKDGGDWYYLDSTGAMVTSWEKVDGIWYYMNRLGQMVTGWQSIGGHYYYFDRSGAMQTGWRQIAGTWYYLQAGGAMQTGWLREGSTWYYFNSSGAMATGWAQAGGKWYYFNTSGAMVTGWQKIGSIWYYFQSSGAMQTGWLKLGNTWYYFKSSGAMATSPVTLGGKTYRFDASGACLNP